MTNRLHIAHDLALPVDAATETFGILAKRGAGKSNAAVVMAEEMYDAGLPWVAIDPKGDWWGVRSSGDGKGPGLPIVVFGGQHGDVPLEPTAGRLVADLIAQQRITAVLDVSLMSKADMRRFLADFAERLYAANTEPLHVFAEEAHEYIPQRVTAGDARMVGAWEKLVKWGRTHGLGVTLITQRSASLNNDVLTQVETLIALRTTGPADQKAIRAWVDEHDTGLAMIAQLRKLGNGEAFVLSPQWLELDEPLRVTFNRRRTFDSGATPKSGQKRTVPRTLADVDLAAIKEQMAETIEKAKADDPKELRKRITALEHVVANQLRELEVERTRSAPEPVVERVEVPVVPQEVLERFSDKAGALLEQLADIEGRLNVAAAARVHQSVPSAVRKRGPIEERFRRPEPASTLPTPQSVHPRVPAGVPQHIPAVGSDGIALRKGAVRMLEALGRMAPLRLTKSQWGTVAHFKTSGGTWRTYLGDIRRAGLIDENSDGFTLTDAGFDYIGGRPAPMSPVELQDHYRTILRAGAAKMLDALIEAYPDGLSPQQLGDATSMEITGGTFRTYVGDLTRNGLAERRDGLITATDILLLGSHA